MELFELLEPTVDREGYELVAVEFMTLDGRPTLRVSIDRPGGVTVKDCSRVSRAISPALDVEDPIDGAYHLEVSSPGIDRPLQRPSDFNRFAGYQVRIQLEAAGPGERRRYKGLLVGARDGEVEVEVDGERHRLNLDSVERARLVLDLDEYQQLAEAPPPRLDTTGEWS